MFGMGTIVNSIAIIIGGLLGRIFGNKIHESLQQTLTKTMGLCTIFLGISGCLEKLFSVEAGTITSNGSMMMIISFTIGATIGEIINIEDKMENFGAWLKHKTKSDSDSSFIDAFVTASLTVCIGAMAVVGSIQDGIFHDPSTLYAKAFLDFIIIMIMAASLGKGALFSFVPVALFQGSITLLSTFIAPLMTPLALTYLSLTGSMLIFCVGVNIIWPKTFKVANMLPTIFIAVIFALV